MASALSGELLQSEAEGDSQVCVAEEPPHIARLRAPGTRSCDLDFLARNLGRRGVIQLDSGLQYKVQRCSKDPAPRPGPTTLCKCHYTGLLADGTEFDSSYKCGKPLVLRPDQAVPGMREAMQRMHQGDRWELVLPSHLGYGEEGAGLIPGGAALVFHIELLEVGVKESAGLLSDLTIPGILFILGLLVFGAQQLTRHSRPAVGPLHRVEDFANHWKNPRVFLNISVGGAASRRVELELFAEMAPKTAENFRALCTGDAVEVVIHQHRGGGQRSYQASAPLTSTVGGSTGALLPSSRMHYTGSLFHRVMPGLVCQGGDITSRDGRGGESIYGPTFSDEWEHGYLHHTEAGLLSMANRGPNTQGSQFFITLAAAPQLDDRHVVFGRVVHGMEVVLDVEAVGSEDGTPLKEVLITDSGQISGGRGIPAHAPSNPHRTDL